MVIELNLAGNRLKKLPKGFGKTQQLKLLNLAENQLTELPDSLNALADFLWRIKLINNKVKHLPASFSTQHIYYDSEEYIAGYMTEYESPTLLLLKKIA